MNNPDTGKEKSSPHGELAVRTLAMPGDTNPSGDIFGGWVLSQMDIAGAIVAGKEARGRIATVSLEAMKFHLPVFVGDVLCCYADVVKIGRTSIQIKIEAWAMRNFDPERVLVTEGIFTYVAINEERKPRVIEKSGGKQKANS
jgi:acyl-CoA thioesterase YciA